ncbi:MAG: hypothetical protein NUK62_05595 [Tenericutes bacterium]|nr:hypothetical protein [Mycoplasmatota bacterium]
MKKISLIMILLLVAAVLFACNEDTGYAGEYIGYSWSGEASGVTFEEATQYIETKMTLDKDGIITNLEIDFKVKRGDNWVSRLDQTSTVSIDYAVVPTIATVGDTVVNGDSMFTVQTQDFMSFYAYGVNSEGVVALAIVDPVTRFMFETRLDADFDYTQKLSALNVGNELNVPTTRVSSFGLVKPTSWDSYVTKNVFNVHSFSHVLTETGVFEGINQNSTVRQLLEALEITFVEGVAQEKAESYGFFGLGGWKGNYEAIAETLIGQNASQMISIIDWSFERYALGINESNEFGIDVQAGGTRTAQDSYDTIAGATVRMSRESTSFQRALVAAGIITEEQVIIGRF